MTYSDVFIAIHQQLNNVIFVKLLQKSCRIHVFRDLCQIHVAETYLVVLTHIGKIRVSRIIVPAIRSGTFFVIDRYFRSPGNRSCLQSVVLLQLI